MDIFLFDYKETSPALHKSFTGVDNGLILENLFRLDGIGAKTILRCPIIPSYNDRDDHLAGIAETANRLKNVIEINIEPYHPLGKGKSGLLGRNYPVSIDFPTDDAVNEWINIIQEKTNVPVRRA